MPAPLSKRALLNRIAEAVYASGWNLLYEPGELAHPFKLRIFKESESYGLLIYIWSLTHGGGAARPKNEYRIQMTGVDSTLRFLTGYKTLLLGWREESRVFVGFDVQKQGSNDMTCNGMTLCKNHHLAYDRGLLKVDDLYRIHPNQRKIDEYGKLRLTDGLDLFLNALHKEIRIPLSPTDRPRPEYLRRGMELRDRL